MAQKSLQPTTSTTSSHLSCQYTSLRVCLCCLSLCLGDTEIGIILLSEHIPKAVCARVFCLHAVMCCLIPEWRVEGLFVYWLADRQQLQLQLTVTHMRMEQSGHTHFRYLYLAWGFVRAACVHLIMHMRERIMHIGVGRPVFSGSRLLQPSLYQCFSLLMRALCSPAE